MVQDFKKIVSTEYLLKKHIIVICIIIFCAKKNTSLAVGLQNVLKNFSAVMLSKF